jgi:hypothetical protein
MLHKFASKLARVCQFGQCMWSFNRRASTERGFDPDIRKESARARRATPYAPHDVAEAVVAQVAFLNGELHKALSKRVDKAKCIQL